MSAVCINATGTRERKSLRTIKGVPVSKINFSLRSTLFLGAASAAALSMSATSFAQESKETVVVTGSRIPQQGIVSASPVTMVSQDEIKLQGATDVGTLMNNLPSVFAGQTSGEGNGASGTITVDLRGLGPARTLVLIDGKRMGPGDPEVPYADLNQIPAALIDHTEVATGGNSAVYGSDAVAGVVNFIMRKDFEGVELDLNAGIHQHDNGNSFLRNLQKTSGFTSAPDSVWDGASFDGTLLIGTNTADGKGNVTAYIGFQRQNQVLQSQRDNSACSLSNKKTTVGGVATYTGLTCAGSFNYDAFVSANGPKKGAYYFMQPGGNLTYFTGDPQMYFNYGAYNSLIRPQTRYEGGMFAHYELDKKLDVYANFMFTDTHNSWQAAPSALFFQSGTLAGGAVGISCDQPYLTAQFISYYCPGGTAGTQQALVYTARRNVEGGGRVTDFRHTAYRAVIGAKGDLGDGWAYDISAQNSVTDFTQLYLHDWSKSAIENSLTTVHGTGGAVTGCVSGQCLDIFHGIGGITPAMEKTIDAHGMRTGSTTQQVVTGSITGDLGQYGVKSPWAADGVGISAGMEYRNDTLVEVTSMADVSGDLYGAGGAFGGVPNIKGIHVFEMFGETQIPVLHDLPYAQNLSLSAGYRYSTYSTAAAKAVHSYKYGAEYQPIDDFRLRASFQRAIRMANILELNKPNALQLDSSSDPCAGIAGTSKAPTATLAQCQATGMTAAQYGTVLQCAANQCNYYVGGNEALKPEKSNTRSFGLVLTPTFLPGFTLTADYFNIDVKDYINFIAPNIIMGSCISGANPALCSLIHRDPVTGGISLNSGTLATSGYIDSRNINTGYLHTKGVDIEANYLTSLDDLGLGDNGSLSANLFGTFVSDYLVQPYTGAKSGNDTNYNCAGLYGVTCGTPTPTWRHKLRMTWSSPWNVDLSFNWRHMSGSSFDGNSANPFLKQGYVVTQSGGGKIAAFDYLDVATSWQVSDGVELSAGVNNVFDRNPPTLASGGKTVGTTGPLNGNTFNGVYDSLGRYMFMSLKLKS